jgi:acyl-CoA dehydrogenase
MLDGLSEELELVRRQVRRFVDTELIPLERQATLDQSTKDWLRDAAKTAGLWQAEIPEALGGGGLDIMGRAVFWEEISRSPVIPPREFSIFGPMVGPLLLGLGGEQREEFLLPVLCGEKTACFAQTEPDAGSDPGAMRTRAVRDGGDYVITGTKRWITDAKTADFAQLMAMTDPAAGVRGISCFLVNMRSPGVSVTAEYNTMMGDRPCEVVFDSVRVPARNLVGREGDGFKLGQRWITEGRILRHGARSCGVAERSLELMCSYAKQRHTFGEPLANRQAVQFMIADTYAELQSARAAVHTAARRADAGEDVRLESWIAKTYGTEMGFRAADRCMQVHGGIGLSTEMPIERMWREQRSFIITEGAAEVMRSSIARKVLDIYG